MSVIEIVFTVLGALFMLVAIPWVTISVVARKIGKGAEAATVGADQLAEMLEQFGLEKAPMVIKEGADVTDELGDLATLFADLTADGNLTADEIKKLWTEGKEGLWVELKDFRIKVFPKKAVTQ